MANQLTSRQSQIAEQVYQEYLSVVRQETPPRLTWWTKDQVYGAVRAVFEARNEVPTVAEAASAHTLEELQQMAQEVGVTVEAKDTKREIARKLGAR
jgi:hypothetical protein